MYHPCFLLPSYPTLELLSARNPNIPIYVGDTSMPVFVKLKESGVTLNNINVLRFGLWHEVSCLFKKIKKKINNVLISWDLVCGMKKVGDFGRKVATLILNCICYHRLICGMKCSFACLPELVPEGKSVSGYVTTDNNRPGHNSGHSQQTNFTSIGETVKVYRLPL